MSLATLKKGERFDELVGLIVKRAFDPKIGKPQNGQPGKMRQGLILTDGTAEMSFTLWGPDVGQVMQGDSLTLKTGWVNAYTDKQGVEKLDLRLRKEGGWTKTGSGANIPQAPAQAPKPEPQYVPVTTPQTQHSQPPSPAAQVVGMDAREANINRQSARRDAVALLLADAGGDDPITVEAVLQFARPLYRWAMNLGPHWMENENSRKRFWATLGEAGLSSNDAHRELNAYSMYDFEGTEQDALNILLPSQKPPEQSTEQVRGNPPPTMPETALEDTGNFSGEGVTTLGEFYGAIYLHLGLNRSQAHDLLGVSDYAEIPGTDYQGKYATVSLAQRKAAV